jgi:hypothetical protein
MSTFSTRKIIAGIVLLITGVLITYWKGDIPNNLLSLMQTLFFAFVAGNGFEHYMDVVKNKLPPQLQNVVDKIEKKEDC